MATNASFIPSSSDLLMVVPRLARKLGSFAISHLPEQMDTFVAKARNGGSIIAEATSGDNINTTVTNITSAFTSTVAASAAASASATAEESNGFLSYLTIPFSSLEGIRSFGGIFAYLGSRWALTTFALSIILNRTHFYASSRQNLTFTWATRILLYSAPIFFLLIQLVSLLQSIKCQASPDYPQYRYRNPEKRLAINFGGDGGFVYHLASTVLFWTNDADCCDAMKMSLQDNNKLNVMGSFSRIWPLFLSLCFSQLVDTMICALQGRTIMPETGMTLFEHSLSFAECEAVIANAIGLDSFGTPRMSTPSPRSNSPTASASASPLLTKSMVLQRLNAPPEVLLICLISCLSHLSSNILAVAGRRDQFRLVNTGVWAICYMSAFVWSFYIAVNYPSDDPNDSAMLRFPTVCIIGFIPHILIIIAIFVCALIYGTALLITAISLPHSVATNPTIKERFRLAYNNLQANVQFSSSSSIRLQWSEDFYTTLLKVGFNILTAASEAVYLNEGSRVHVHRMTWLEEKRLEELASRAGSRRKLGSIPPELVDDNIARGLEFTDIANDRLASGYARERRSKTGGATVKSARLDGGVGVVERRGKWQLTYELIAGINTLLARTSARLLIATLGAVGIRLIPQWLRRAADNQDGRDSDVASRAHRAETPDFWLVSDEGTLSIPENGNVDVEIEMRRRLRAGASGADPSEEVVDADLYDWWKRGGWWGDLDRSGDYAAREVEDDTTSMISMSTNASDAFDDESGRRTPTQDDYLPAIREETPEPTFGIADLSRLLDPKSAQDREEAQMLSRHLQSDRPMTRSQYRRRLTRDKARLLTGPLDEGTSGESNDKLRTEAEEEAALEHFILERRAMTGSKSAKGASWDSGAEGMGSSGPQCVVCQSNPRVIMVWPCGCLSICDDCRIGVATRNFASCMTCRTPVTAYSRLYVP